jgi:uncharacterized membrane protein
VDVQPFLEASWLVQAHLAAATVAILLGVAQFVLPKGVTLHRVTGWTWVCLVAFVALTSLFIRNDDDTLPSLGVFSPVHLFTFAAMVGLPVGVYAARRRNVLLHRASMIAVFAGALIVAGLFAVMPGRLIYETFFAETAVD